MFCACLAKHGYVLIRTCPQRKEALKRCATIFRMATQRGTPSGPDPGQ
jgi:hypothetical protein